MTGDPRTGLRLEEKPEEQEDAAAGLRSRPLRPLLLIMILLLFAISIGTPVTNHHV